MNTRSTLLGPFYLALILASVLVIFWPTFRNLLAIDGGNEGFTHRIFAIPIFCAQVWGLRFELSKVPARSCWFGLFGIAVAGAAWLGGELTYIRLLTHVSVITMVPMAVLTIFGYRWLWTLSFPLFCLLFAIPFSGPLVPFQVDWTARFTYLALLASGVPVLREGPYFELPTGTWAIADACSGIGYLSAVLMFTFLYSWTTYRSLKKRALFIAGGIIVGIVGNWMRAFLTIWIAHISDNRLLREDHGTFGWLLFAAFLFLYCWLGWHFRDPAATVNTSRKTESGASLSGPSLKRSWLPAHTTSFRIVAAWALTLITLAMWPIVNALVTAPQPTNVIDITAIPPAQGWLLTSEPVADWKPTLVNPRRVSVQHFEKSGRRVDVFIGIYSGQSWTSKLVTSVNQFIAENSGWSLVDRGAALTYFLGQPLEVKTGVLLGHDHRLLAWQWYWIDGIATGSDLAAKRRQLRIRLNGNADTSAWIAVYTPAENSTQAAATTLHEFMHEMSGSLDLALLQSTRAKE